MGAGLASSGKDQFAASHSVGLVFVSDASIGPYSSTHIVAVDLLIQTDIESGAIELTFIGVAVDKRNQGLGRELLNAFMETSRSLGYHSVILSVEREDVPAIRLYEKAGFKIIQSFSEGRYKRYRMERVLA
jgi:ribosomal protein S18 acetylase RimI-like enzyme